MCETSCHGLPRIVERSSVTNFGSDEWLPAVRHTVRASTFAEYESKARVHLVPRLGGIPLQRLTASQLNALYGELLAELAPSTVRQVHAVAYRVLQSAVRWRFVPRNVAADADPPRPATERELRTWTADELRRFLGAIRDHRLYAVYHLLASTGARRGEALGARWEDFDLDAARWTVCRNLTPAGETAPKTGRARRSVALDAATVRVLREWRKHQLEERLAWGPAWQDTGRTFTREDGTDLTPNIVSQTFPTLVRRVDVPPIRLHDLRHTHVVDRHYRDRKRWASRVSFPVPPVFGFSPANENRSRPPPREAAAST